ncbi:MAG: DUF488 domain-containing protein [Pseudolabrys sp.]
MATRGRKTTAKTKAKTKAPARKARAAPKSASPRRTASRPAGKRVALCTIGYEKALPRAVIGELTRAGVKLVVDVRAVAASRRPGFSKKQLAAGLDEAGIAYLHLQPLGTPEAGREAARAGHIDALFRIYDRHLQTKAAQESLGELTDLVKARKPMLALLCYCRNPNACHRSRIVATLEERMPLSVDDLVPPPA